MKKLYLILTIIISSCTKMDLPEPTASSSVNIFSVTQSEVNDGQEIMFDLKSEGTYTLTIGNSENNQVITREKFTGKTGQNKLILYTKSLPKGSLYLLLEDSNKSTVNKTIIIIK
jgi:hypothetical protein